MSDIRVVFKDHFDHLWPKYSLSREKNYMVGVTGFEPVTLRLSSACSNQLSYTPNKVGGAEESRTPDL